MSGLEVMGGISAIIAIIEASIKIYDSTRSDMALPETFETVRTRLPIIANILQTCKNDLEPTKDSMPAGVCEALKTHIRACDGKASKLREIFEKIMLGDSDTWSKRQFKVIRRLGKGNKVDGLMLSLSQDVQLIVNNHMLGSTGWQRSCEFGSKTKDPQQKVVGFQESFGLCLGQAPYISSDLFMGRDLELDSMEKALIPGGNLRKQQRLVISGIGGIGKTQLAIAYAERHADLYKSIFWLNAASEAILQASFRSLAGLILNIKEPGLLEPEEILTRVHQWLSAVGNTQWLLIFDNHDDPSLFEIENYYPPTSHGTILVTTRRPDLVAGTIIRIQPIRRIEDSLAILQARSQRENVQSDIYAKHLAERLAGLPLALATAGAYLQRSTLTFQRYLEEYEKRWDIDPRNPPRLQEYQMRTLYTTWDLSHVSLEMYDPDAARILKLLAYFDNQSLWYELFYSGLQGSSPRWLHEVIADDVNFDAVMRRLTDYCFLDVQAASQSWSMHNCVHDWTLASLNKDIDKELYWYAFDCATGSVAGVEEDLLGHSCYSRSAAHAKRLVHQRFYQSESISVLKSDRLIKASHISRLLREHVHLDAAEQMYLWVLAGHEKVLGADHTSTLQIVDALGLLYHDQGELDRAEQMYLRALAGFEKALGSEHKLTIRTVNNTGMLYSSQGKLDQAEIMYLRALAGFEKALGSDHKLTLRTINNIGLLYSAQGRLYQAEQMYIRALAGFEKALGSNHIFTLRTVNNTGMLYSAQGKLDQAEEMYLRALAGFEKAFGSDHAFTLRAVNNIGLLYSAQGKQDQAEQMYLRALAGFEKAFKADHTFTLRTVSNIALLYNAQGKQDQAKQMYLRALIGFEKSLGVDHPSTLHTVHGLGSFYQEQGQLDQAEQMYLRALVGFQKALGADHPSTIYTVNSLGVFYQEQGQLDRAEQMNLRALVGFEKALGVGHQSTLQTVHNLGNLYADQGKLDEAEQMYLRALIGREKALGADHVSTLRIVHDLGNLYADQDKLDEAEQMYLRALIGREKALGANHPSALRTIHNLGVLYQDQDKPEEAERMYLRALTGREKALGANHPSTLRTVHNLGVLYQDQDKPEEAERMYLWALPGREKALGTNHGSTLRTAKSLKTLYHDQGKLHHVERACT
ncbi:hypothetical protein PENNAL_c0269G11109 [Penicillium nalgiovense]|uniref:NACHT-NTPase and P-loop NTPases N-terminal domain-containing protein n=1 Tax=Penicillium nalgiovense TaxID=60175 RepID=A0A1V6WGX0_PENNA|nr:hypothetical protein PENNAL_c0269G11109 [Penicillium nalgiovense]